MPPGFTPGKRLQFRLEANPLYPRAMQVNCKRAECVGLGYLGFEQVMCFICEETWNADEETVVDPTSSSAMDAFKACPKCGVLIEKNGGCDHMTCKLCRHEWWWSTGKNYRTG